MASGVVSLIGIGDAEETGGPPVNRDEHHGLTFATERVSLCGQRAGIDAEVVQQRAIAERDHARFDATLDALAGDRFEALGIDQRQSALFGPTDDGRGERMLAAAFKTGGQPQHTRVVHAVHGLHADQLRLADRERAGLVDDQRVDFAHHLDRLGVLEEDARPWRPCRWPP